MKKFCPNYNCQNSSEKTAIVKDGTFFRACDSRFIQRFKCRICGKKFSAATGKLEYRQQKRRENSMIFKLLASNVSMRRSAKILNLSRETLKRRLFYFAEKSRLKQGKLREKMQGQVTHLQIDDLVTKENSKLKPLSLTVAIDAEKRIILAAQVSQIPSFGNLAKYSLKKYGKRKCFHQSGIDFVLRKIKKCIHPNSLIRSDEHKKYPGSIKKYLPGRRHEVYKSMRATVAGQGELKRGGYDSIFMINHTCAMLRANVSRLIRKTWCTTKDPRRLQDHVDLFIWYYNQNRMSELSYIPSG